MTKFAHMGLVALLLLCSFGCIHKSTPVTPWERVTTENAILAQLIKTSEQGTEAVQTSGLITAQQAMPIIQFEGRAAEIQTQINSILAQSPTAANIPQIQALVTQIGASAKTLVDSGALGIKNPKSQQTIGADVQAIVGSANLILSAYQTAVGGQ